MNANSRFGLRWPLLFVPLVALLVVVPYHFRETSCGHDLTFHVTSWLETTQQWKEGIVYPRWAAEANYGHGEPRFIFYPPISWLVGALLGLVLPWKAVPAAIAFLACTASGFSLYLFAREWLEDRAALCAAVVYAANPYQLMVIYERSALAELVAAALVPLVLLHALRESEGFWRQTVFLSLALAATWLTNAPAGVMATYLLFFVGLLRAIATRRWEPLLRGATGLLLALALAGFYLLPALYEQKWVIISQALSPGARPQDNFLFGHMGDADHDAVLHRVSVFCLIEFAAVILTALMALPLRRKSPFFYRLLAATAALCVLLMFPASNFLWQHLPKLAYLQFPWRWLLVLNLVLAIFIAVSVTRVRLGPILLAVVMPTTILLGYVNFHQSCYPEDRVEAIVEQFRSGGGYEGTDEYCPITGDNYNIDADTATARIETRLDADDDDEKETRPPKALPASVHSAVQRWEAEYRSFTIDSPAPTRNLIQLLNYPAWKVEVDGAAFTPETAEDTGRMVLALPAGHHQVVIRFLQTRDRFWGGIISMIGVVIAFGLWLIPQQRPLDQRSEILSSPPLLPNQPKSQEQSPGL